jgi:chemosensory pili system protein ChpE
MTLGPDAFRRSPPVTRWWAFLFVEIGRTLPMLATAVAGLIMAISMCAPPGPVAMETVRRGLRGGFRPALNVQLGSIIGDVTWCGLALIGLAPLAQIGWVRVILAVAGVGVLLYLGAVGLRDAFAARQAVAVAASPHETKGAFRSGLAISMANPMAIGYWLSVGGALVATGVAGGTPAQTTAFILGFVGGTVAWAFLMAFAVRWSSVILSPLAFRGLTLASSVALVVFGILLAVRMFEPLL